MKTLYPDLFPETLLVAQRDGRAIATSQKVAEHFRKRHADVLRAIENLFSDMPSQPNFRLTDERNFALISEFRRLNFEPSSYLDSRGRTKPMYEMTEEGFALVAMGFTGPAAVVWKIEFLNAFREMERQLQVREAQFSAAFDQVRPFVRPVVEATERGLCRAAIASPLGKSANAITYHRRQAKRFGLLSG